MTCMHFSTTKGEDTSAQLCPAGVMAAHIHERFPLWKGKEDRVLSRRPSAAVFGRRVGDWGQGDALPPTFSTTNKGTCCLQAQTLHNCEYETFLKTLYVYNIHR
ncbi:hypothetical protein PtB15_3B219 [Puccinia triticina]|nr:hypothetical protein PtB15_3B219 [Puccinia triticina]